MGHAKALKRVWASYVLYVTGGYSEVMNKKERLVGVSLQEWCRVWLAAEPNQSLREKEAAFAFSNRRKQAFSHHFFARVIW